MSLRNLLGIKPKRTPTVADLIVPPPYVPPPYVPADHIVSDAVAEAVAARYGLNDLDLVRLICAIDGGGVVDGRVIVCEPPWARLAYILARRDERHGVDPKPFEYHEPLDDDDAPGQGGSQ
jgi:hypothetical protein